MPFVTLNHGLESAPRRLVIEQDAAHGVLRLRPHDVHGMVRRS
jgi:hypothetical protein